MLMVLVYINNKPKIDDRFIFKDTIKLTEPCLLRILMVQFLVRHEHKETSPYIFIVVRSLHALHILSF